MDGAVILAILALGAALAWLAWEVRTLHEDAMPIVRIAESPVIQALVRTGQ